MIKRLWNDERGAATISINALVVILLLTMFSVLVIDTFYLGVCYLYVKTEADMANRAVYADVDPVKLADREFYIDATVGEQKFYEYLKKNLKLDNDLKMTGTNLRIVGPIKVLDFKIYNSSDLPAVSPLGNSIEKVTVFSRLEIQVQPIFYGLFGNITIRPYIETNLPDKYFY